MSIALMYHDVTEPGREDESGFPGPAAARYKLTRADFARHLEALARIKWDGFPNPSPLHGTRISSARDGLGSPSHKPIITIDDGGVSALHIADQLEMHGWRGHFFITTDYIGRPAFLTAAHLQDLRRRGHVIGSHSCSHPPRLSACSWADMLREWRESKQALEGILGEPIQEASVPGGFYSSQVAKAAAQAGYTVLFNSEPTKKCYAVDGCIIHGRFTLRRGSTPDDAVALATGRGWRRWRQNVWWQVKKAVKFLGLR